MNGKEGHGIVKTCCGLGKKSDSISRRASTVRPSLSVVCCDIYLLVSPLFSKGGREGDEKGEGDTSAVNELSNVLAPSMSLLAN